MIDCKRLLSLVLAVAMVFSLASPAAAVEHDHGIGLTQVSDDRITETLNGRQEAEIPSVAPAYAEDEVLRVSIFLEKKGTIDAGYSPMDISNNSAALNYNQGLKKEQETMTQKISNAIGQKLDVVWNLTLATNLISANVQYGQIAAIEALPGVRKVVIENIHYPDVVEQEGAAPNMNTSGNQIGSYNAWTLGYTGAGTRVAIIDTGLDVKHQSFDAGAFRYSLEKLAEQNGVDYEEYVESLNLLDAGEINKVLTHLNAYERGWGLTGADLFFTDKVAYGYNYVDWNLDLSHYDSEHGSHVAGISAANSYIPTSSGYDSALATTGVQGVAPEAQLLVMKVFGEYGGAYDSDIMAAIEDAVLLGSDAVNLSLGTSAAGMTAPYYDEYTQILKNLEQSGVVVTISAGNNSYWAEATENGQGLLYADDVSFHTGGSPGTFVNSLCVASADNTAHVLMVGGYNLDYAESLGYGNAPISSLDGTYEYIYVDTVGAVADFAAVGRENLEGKIVLCNRGGGISFADKANAAAAMGAVGVIVVNTKNEAFNMDLTGYEYDVPVVGIPSSYGQIFRNCSTSSSLVGSMKYWNGTVEIDAQPYYMSSFSSWGVPGSLEMKPEITAPGGWILSVAGAIPNFDYCMDHASYEYMSGTSMAAPQVAGMSAVLSQFIRETGLDIKTGQAIRTLAQSLLMSTAVPLVDPTNTTYNCYYPVLQQGAGMANVSHAIQADSYIIMGADANDSWADGKVKAELGDDPDKTGVYSFSFTIHNLTDMDKVFALSADFFTQALCANNELLDTWTRPLAPEATWTVDGKIVENGAALAGMDFDGNGTVNHDDGQALLDYAAGLRAQLTNMDKADLDGDGTVDTYDAYIFYDKLEDNGALVPAGGSATVSVTVTLSQADHALLADYPVGAYIQGFVYAKSLATEEGMAGTSHSIPVLGFYGNWTDASMFDKGSAMEYFHGEEDRMPYLYSSNYLNEIYNGLLFYDASEVGYYWFGGNPVIQDETYMPERNAFNPQSGDEIDEMYFSLIRNAGGIWSYVWNADTEKYDERIQRRGETYAAYYIGYPYYFWDYTWDSLTMFFDGQSYSNNTHLEIGMIAVPEYYFDDDGNVDWDALGDGAEFSMPLVIDNEDPKVHSASVDTENNLLNVQVGDNQHIAAVVLYDNTGRTPLVKQGSQAQAQAGDTLDYTLDLSTVNGAGFLLVVYDYAGNKTVYELDMQLGETVDYVDAVTVSPETLILQVGDTAQLTAQVLPANTTNRGVSWYSENPDVVTVDQNGNIQAVGAGSTNVYAVSTYDANIYGCCYVEVEDLGTKLNAIIWSENLDIWYSQFDVNAPWDFTKLSGDLYYHTSGIINTACVGYDGTIYVATKGDPGRLYTMDPDDYTVEYISKCTVDGTNVFFADMTYAPACLGYGMILAASENAVLVVDPTSGECLGKVDEFDTDIVGITTVESYYYYSGGSYIYEDVVLVILNDGRVIMEDYAGYDGYLFPYYYLEYEGYRPTMYTGIDLGSTWYYNSAYYDGEYLYWSCINTGTATDYSSATLYAIDIFDTGDIYDLGEFGSGYWPVGGLHEKNVAPQIQFSSTVRAELTPEIMANLNVSELGTKTIDISKIPEDREKITVTEEVNVSGSGSVAAPMSDIDRDNGTVTVDITAVDANGAAVDSNNGLISVTYDPEKMTLVGVQVNSQYSAYRDLDGTVTIAYVDLAGIAADETIVTLEFQMVGDTAQVAVIHQEVNDQNPGWMEVLAIGCTHENMTHTPAQDPTCTEPGNVEFWTCPDCGKQFLDAAGTMEAEQEDLLVEATGHTWGDWETVVEPTEENPGQKKRACAKCGEEEFETIPSTGVFHGDCNADGKINAKDVVLLRQHLAGWDVEIDLENADCNGDGKVNAKDVVLLRQYLAGWDVTLGPEVPEEDPNWIVGEWIYMEREEFDSGDKATASVIRYYLYADGTGEKHVNHWFSWDVNTDTPSNHWIPEEYTYVEPFVYTWIEDKVNVVFGDNAYLVTYDLVHNPDGYSTMTYVSYWYTETFYQIHEEMTIEEMLELADLEPNVPGYYEGPEVPVDPEDPNWIVGYWTNVTRRDYYDDVLEAWMADVTEINFVFYADGTGFNGGYEWTNWDYENGCPGDHWEVAPMGYDFPSFTYTLEGDRLTIVTEYYDRYGDYPEVYTFTDVYIVSKNDEGSITLTNEESGYGREYRQADADATVEELLELFDLDPNVPDQYEGPEVSVVPKWVTVSRVEEDWGGDVVAWVDVVSYTFRDDGTGYSSHKRWVSWDSEVGAPSEDWEATSDDGVKSFTYTLEGDQLTINTQYDEPEVYISTKVYTVTENADGSLTFTITYDYEDYNYSESTVYRQVEGNPSVEELLELFDLDPNVP